MSKAAPDFTFCFFLNLLKILYKTTQNVNENEASIMEGCRLSFFSNKMFNIGYGPPPNTTPHTAIPPHIQRHPPLYIGGETAF